MIEPSFDVTPTRLPATDREPEKRREVADVSEATDRVVLRGRIGAIDHRMSVFSAYPSVEVAFRHMVSSNLDANPHPTGELFDE